MNDVPQLLKNELDLLKTRVVNLYKDYEVKISFLIETNKNRSIEDIIQ